MTSPTGHRLSEPEMQDFYPHQREAMKKLIANPEIIIVGKDTGFAALEARVLASMCGPEVTSIMLDIECSPDEMMVILARDLPDKEAEADLKPPPSYLRHDPTKNVKRRRRGRR